jgi:hypothetical protein
MRVDDAADNTWQALPGSIDCRATARAAVAALDGGRMSIYPAHAAAVAAAAYVQGLTLVHISAQCKRFLWDRGYIEGLLRG